MTRVQINLVANFIGQGWMALMALAFVPLYIKFLGIEAYGLIGFYAMLQAVFQVLDLGLSQTMNREMARYSALPDKAGEARDIVRTLEVGYWAIGLVLGIAILIASPFIAGHWIKSGSIPVSTVQHAVMIMGAVAALQWPLSFYEGGLMGLQQQVLFNIIRVGIATLGGFGAIFILWKVSPTITAFFTWQIVVNGLFAIVSTIALWRKLPASGRPAAFNVKLLGNIGKFAAGMSGIALSGLALTNLDKLILSKLLSLEMYGCYTLAGVTSSMVMILAMPVYNSIFPRFTSLVAVNDYVAITALYHQGSQLMSVIVFPVAALLTFFSYDILFLWTGSASTALTAAPLVSILAPGMAFQALMTLPYSILLLSYGWTNIWLRINAFSILILVPAIYVLTKSYGAVGAASVWSSLFFAYILIGVPFIHKRLLPGEMPRWFRVDIIPPLIAAILITSIGRWLISGPMQTLTALVSLSAVLLTSYLAALLAAPGMRNWLFTQLQRIRTH